MSIEYSAAIKPSEDCMKKVIFKLQEDTRYHILWSDDRTRILLRFTRTPPREKWPEDVELKFGEGIYVVFHAADRNDREGLLELLQTSLKQCGHSVQFVEE